MCFWERKASRTGNKVVSANLYLPPEMFVSPKYGKEKEVRQTKGTILKK